MMLFADTFYFIALLNTKDKMHARAIALTKGTERLLTTEWVLTELADGLAPRKQRGAFLSLLQRLRGRATVEIAHASHALFDRGIDLYSRRPDKDWSLTDCISFIVMQEHGITNALTGDHHFEQAGFNALLK